MMRVEYDRVWMMNTNSECILIFGSYFYIEHYFSVDALDQHISGSGWFHMKKPKTGCGHLAAIPNFTWASIPILT